MAMQVKKKIKEGSKGKSGTYRVASTTWTPATGKPASLRCVLAFTVCALTPCRDILGYVREAEGYQDPRTESRVYEPA